MSHPVYKYKFIALFVLSLWGVVTLTGCTSKQTRNENYAAHEAYLQKLYQEYVGQFLPANAPHATLIGFPYPGYDVFKPSAFVPSSMGGKKVQSVLTLKGKFDHPLQPWDRPQYGYYLGDQTLLPLRIEPGQYDIVTFGGGYSGKMTVIKDAIIQAGKTYAIYPQMKDGKRLLTINEYAIDKRFSPGERDYYVVGKAVSKAQEWGKDELTTQK